MMNPDAGRFVVGTGRCGTTLLCRMLAEHPRCLAIDESHWIPRVQALHEAGVRDSRRFLSAVEDTWHVGGTPVMRLPPPVVDTLLELPAPVGAAEFSDAVFAALAAHAGRAIWVDKTPDYCCHIPVLHALWPGARVLHVTRDAEWTVRSMSRHPGYQALVANGAAEWCSLSHRRDLRAPERPGTDLEAYRQLRERRLQAYRGSEDRLPASQRMELAFEDLVAHPRRSIRDVYGFFGLSPSATVVERAAALVDRNRVAHQFSGAAHDA